MSAAPLVIASSGSSLRNGDGLRMVMENSRRRSNDLVIVALARLIAVLGRVARRRRRRQIVRNRVETQRELARLPKRVRDDVMFADPLINHNV